MPGQHMPAPVDRKKRQGQKSQPAQTAQIDLRLPALRRIGGHSMFIRSIWLWLFALSLFAAVPASADPGFVPLPVSAGAPRALEIQVQRYEGSTNGQLTVSIRNPTDRAVKFEAGGLYFVPEQNANDAPQRLGAAGPFAVQKQSGGFQPSDGYTLSPNSQVEVKLDVYCIDSHRRSPRTGDVFRVAVTRMPADLTRSIQSDTNTAARQNGGYAAPAAKSAVQSEIWKNRNKKWIELDGEGVQEKRKDAPAPQMQHIQKRYIDHN